MEHEIDIVVQVTIDGLRHTFDLDSDGLAGRGSNQSDPTGLADGIAEAMQRAVWNADGDLIAGQS